MDILIAFITGLTTGGLSCLAVQGGLLTSSLANQLEQDVRDADPALGVKAHIAQPILWFLAAKIAAYTLVGLLLGALGSVFELSPLARAFLQIGIGIFMVGAALRMFNVHPIFRYFVFEPPSWITRYIRRTAKGQSAALTPAFLGLLTVLIPCGITQVMMATAITTGDPLKAAALMFAFTLGTSPVFFFVAYFATRLGKTLEKYFLKGIAVVMLLIGLLTINTGLNLMGSPFSFENMLQATTGSAQAAAPADENLVTEQRLPTPIPMEGCPMHSSGQVGDGLVTPIGPQLNLTRIAATQAAATQQAAAAAATQAVPTQPAPTQAAVQTLTINVKNTGYEPATLHAKGGVPIQLRLVSQNTQSCSLAFVIPSLGIQKTLKPTGIETLTLPAQKAGSTLRYSCSMGMYTGKIVFDG
jgi:sulfite exporter TauE/SafE